MRNLYTAIFFLFISSCTIIFGQENTSPESLYALRRSQAQSGQDYTATEKALLSATGAYPTALVTTATSAAGKSFEFITYKEISEEKQDRIEQRLIVSVAGIQSVEINHQHVSVNFSPETTEENILLFFKLLGYINYEIK